MFVARAWRQAAAYHWTDSHKLSITTSESFSGVRTSNSIRTSLGRTVTHAVPGMCPQVFLYFTETVRQVLLR